MKQLGLRIRALSGSLMTVVLVGCAPSLGSLVENAATLRGANEGFDRMFAGRGEEVDLAGTYRLDFDFPGEEPITVWVRTTDVSVGGGEMDAAALPATIGNTSVGDRVQTYMLQAYGGSSLDEVPETFDPAAAEENGPPPVVGIFFVTEPIRTDEAGSVDYVYSWMVAPSENAQGEAARLGRLMTAAEAQHDRDVAAGRASDEEIGRFLVDRDASVLSVDPGAAVAGEQVYTMDGDARYRVRFERVSLEAIDIGELGNPSLSDFFRGG